MLYSVILADACYEPAVEILNPTKLEGWNGPMGVPYWVVAYGYNNREKWRPHRRDHCTVYGEGGFWTGMLEHTEFYIQDLDFQTDPRFEAGLKKYRWEHRAKELKRQQMYETRYVHYEGGFGNVAVRVGGGGGGVGGAGGGGGGVGYVGGGGDWVMQPPQPVVDPPPNLDALNIAPQPAVAPDPEPNPMYFLEADAQPVVRPRGGLRIRERLEQAAARVLDPRPMARDEYGAALIARAHPVQPAPVLGDPVAVRRRIQELNEIRERHVAEILNAPAQQALPDDLLE